MKSWNSVEEGMGAGKVCRSKGEGPKGMWRGEEDGESVDDGSEGMREVGGMWEMKSVWVLGWGGNVSRTSVHEWGNPL